MPDLAATAVSIACPGCRRLVPVGAPCPSCGRAAAPAAVTRDLTVVLDPAQDDTRVMDPVPAAPRLPPVRQEPAAREARRGRRPAAVIGGAAALLLVTAAAVAGLRSGSGSADRTAP